MAHPVAVTTPRARKTTTPRDSRALRTPGKPEAVVTAIIQTLDGFGIQPAEKVEPLPPIALDDVRLIAWMAVEGTKSGQTVVPNAAGQ